MLEFIKLKTNLCHFDQMHAVNEELEEEELRDIFYFSFLLSQSIDFEQRNKVRSEFIYKKNWMKKRMECIVCEYVIS